MKRKRDYLKFISSILAVTAFLVVVVSFFLWEKGDFRLQTTRSIDISKDWKNLDTDQVEERDVVTILPGASLKLSRTLPSGLNDDNVVGYYDYGFRVIAYVDNEEIYSWGKDNYGKFGTQICQAWKTIPLKEKDSGRTFTIIFQNDTDASLQINLNRMEITYTSSEFVRAITTSGWAIGIIIVCFLICIVLFSFGIVVLREGFEESFHRLIMLATLSLVVGVWSWANSSLMQLMFSNESFAYHLSYLSYFFIPMFWGMFYERVYEEPNHVFYLINTSYRFVLAIAFFLYVFGIVPLAQSVFLAHAYLFVELLLGNYFGIKAYIKERSHTNHWSFIGEFVFLIVSAVYIPLYYLRGEQNVYTYAGLAFIAFALCMALSQGYYLFQDLSSRRRELEYRDRSKINPITGGNSMIGLSYRLEEMDFRGIDAPWMVVMDLTNFAAINAQFGWKSSKAMIRGIYETNQASLSPEDYQATEGDTQYVFLLPAEKDIETFCKNIAAGLVDYMGKNWQNAFLAARFSAVRVNPGDDLNKLMACANLAYHGRDQLKPRDTFVYYYDGDCYDRMIKSQVVENEVNRALLKEQMHLLINPVYEVESGKICQADTILAWNVKAEGDMFEYEFIPEAEKNLLGVSMNNAHFEKAMECIHKYSQFKEYRLSVRIFRECMLDHNFWNRFLEKKNQYRIPDLSWLDFEVSMDIRPEDIPILKESVRILHEDGATISASQFDGSLKSIQIIKELEMDCVKFDRRLLSEARESNYEIYLQIEHLVNLLHQQGQKVCICGVAEQDEIEMLKLIGVDRMCGDGLHRPVYTEAFIQLLNEDKEG